ncbi:hypothetical protein [Agitococcus lubricus]|uniref:Poly(Hydroxyalkanoate) granule associated protein phasin n=1 Tax=Agitococcus lubricus TaxID=1077255 RepID=A0A2T5J0P6_9GAMM|nr:hypothetical protein [Agitococcus lubricus]PTQ89967.1 hypothetical protein C8N29_1045 [Agitococcus lubricus]
MGELKEVAETQAEISLVDRVKELGQQVTLAGFGVVAKLEEVFAKVEEESQKQLDKLVAAGQVARGEQAAADKKVVLVAFGLVETVKAEADKLKVDVKGEAEKLKGEAEKLKADAQKLFSDLVAAGEKRKAA